MLSSTKDLSIGEVMQFREILALDWPSNVCYYSYSAKGGVV